MSGRRHRYGAYTGGPDPLAPPVDVTSFVDRIGERVLAGDSLREAVRDLLRHGEPGRTGLADLAAATRRRRQDLLRSGRLDGALTRAAALLDQALAAEREALDGLVSDDADGAARFARARLDALPTSTAAAVRDLHDYEWTSPQAEQLYRQILDGLREQVLDQQFAGMRDALNRSRTDPDAMLATTELMTDLTSLLRAHAAGADTTDQFDQFMARHGDALGERPQTIEDLVDLLARRAATAAQLMASLRADQQIELQELMAQAMAGLGDQLAELSHLLRELRPDLGWQRRQRTTGQDGLDYSEATGVLGELSELDELLDQFDRARTLDAVDVDLVARHLGRAAADDLRRLTELERALREQGWVAGVGGAPMLTPKALRRLGATALRQVFADLDGTRRGHHDVRSAGAAGEVTGATRGWELGDTQPVDVVRTVSNAVRRTLDVTGRVGLDVADFEVAETEHRAGAAVALCVDLSYSMVAQGRWGPMKQTALALAHLIATRYPQDQLAIIGFGPAAMPLTAAQLAALDPAHEQGTNLAHALALAGRHLRRHGSGDPVVLVVTDGEPTAHLIDGEPFFCYPPLRETVEATIREVDQLTRFGARLNVFLLGDDPGLRRFMDAVARRSGGRVFTPDPDELGAYVVADYVRSRRRHGS